MSITRRTFLQSTATTAAVGLLAANTTKIWAQSSLAMGDKKIDVLSDGNLRLPVSSLMNGVPKDEVDAFFTKHKLSLDALEPSCNLTLVRDGERTILFDVGFRPKLHAKCRQNCRCNGGNRVRPF